MRRRLQRMAAAVLAAGMVLTAGGFQGEECQAAEASPNLIECPDFAQGEDASVWCRDRGLAVITARTGEEIIYGEVTTYGKITGRKSNYECFSQDITGVVEKDRVYTYSFYVMLDPVDYADAPAEQRCVEFSPYITANGSTTYSMGCSGTVSQVLEPGVWTYFTGTYTPTWSGNLEQVVIRILEQGTNYGQGAGVMGTYYLTGMELREQGEEESVIQMDVPRLIEAVALQTEEDFIMGTSIVNSDLSDGDTMALVSRHFNAVTLGNELKPDAMFGYSSTCPGTETVTMNGEKLVVPRLDFSRAEKTLDWIYDWNQSNPDDPIKVRGHVLVWHSQTPEWWFHEDYDADKPYVDTETMNCRLEWYIKTVAEHFTGADSKYRGMFYGWDVVNEAVSDNVARYRNAAENSSWWAVYQSNEFIINAFRYANQYMDPEVELYYNDYNEWFSKKRMGIEMLLNDVLAAEGTRIDGMGMQGHYQTAGSPTMEEFAKAARAYAAIVGQVQITELDMKASDSYDGTEVTREAEFLKEGYRYEELFDTVKNLRDEGVNITNITVWGVVDKNSWLQTFHSVGGASDGIQKQCPLLFDDDYQVKPAYWAFVDSSRIEEPESTPKPTAAPIPTAAPKPTASPVLKPTAAPAATATPHPTEKPESISNLVGDFVRRMYIVALNRESEPQGEKYWVDRLQGHESDGAAIAYGFIMSEEFQKRSLSDEEYIEVLYRTFFDRPADAEGRESWLSALETGRSRGYVLSGFVNSVEFDTLCDSFGIIRGTMREDGSTCNVGIRQFVERQYTKVLNRVGEKEGIAFWTEEIIYGRQTPEEVGKLFFQSEEFLARNLNDADYVEVLYETFLGRASEPEGKNFWIQKLEAGMSRNAVLEGFSQSQEFARILDDYGL